MVEYYFEFVQRLKVVDFRYLDREIIPEQRREEFMLVRPSVAFLIQQSAGSSIHSALSLFIVHISLNVQIYQPSQQHYRLI